MSLFDFSGLITEYGLPVQIIFPAETKGHYDEQTGEWVPPKPADPIDTTAVVIPYSSNQIYQSGGRITATDRQLIIQRDIPIKSTVVCDGHKYSVEQELPYKSYAGFNQYDLKWVSAFEQ
ncbi:hypothetical protein [Heyndrickxia coagulans]|uniref:hypothetical protein n=1 Tax=Heyndrickxia coagulans TaxID=1398 RepID=UPI0022361DBA|nr:hypothetical protein [Heyndrickxia coagulans]MED4933996.1 hypothetical protein [Heyndrickxia coagulans]UZH06396.1 hypothetical protein ONG97_00180 [Heyndrickxia coagulans]UZH06449.1 hypothetical protein ONG97_00490 [Heyndrickxia coagulans]